jgi:hypothetical protein
VPYIGDRRQSGGRFAWNAFAFDHHFAAEAEENRSCSGVARIERAEWVSGAVLDLNGASYLR